MKYYNVVCIDKQKLFLFLASVKNYKLYQLDRTISLKLHNSYKNSRCIVYVVLHSCMHR